MRLYDNAFSPFAHKVRLALRAKGLEFERVDALAKEHLPELRRVNLRAEVPVLVDGELVVRNSADILAYLEHRYPSPALYPADPALRVKAREWERLADTVFDAILHDASLWIWPTLARTDTPPSGLLAAARTDILALYERLDRAIGEHEFIAGDTPSIADLALLPHLSGAKSIGAPFDRQRYPNVARWCSRLRALPFVRQESEDLRRAVEALLADPKRYETVKVVWRGDRIEWLFQKGFVDFWLAEVGAGRVIVPSAL
jgi:glutathione S-transferase